MCQFVAFNSQASTQPVNLFFAHSNRFRKRQTCSYLILPLATVFVGAAIGVAKNNHIQVDFFFRFLPTGAGRALSLLVDVLRIAFLGCASWLTWELMQKMGSYQMTIVNLPMNLVYGVVWLAFVLMTWRSVWVMRQHLRQGHSVLERPDNR